MNARCFGPAAYLRWESAADIFGECIIHPHRHKLMERHLLAVQELLCSCNGGVEYSTLIETVRKTGTNSVLRCRFLCIICISYVHDFKNFSEVVSCTRTHMKRVVTEGEKINRKEE